MAQTATAEPAPAPAPAPTNGGQAEPSLSELADQPITLDEPTGDDAGDKKPEDEGQPGDKPVDKPAEGEEDEPTGDDDKEEPPAPDAPKDGDQPSGNEADDKPTRAQERIRDLVAERNELRKQVAANNEQVYAAREASDLLTEVNPLTGEEFTPAEAEVQAMKEREQLRDYNDRVAEAQLVINTEAGKVLDEFPMFNAKSKEYNKELTESMDDIFAQNLIRDQNTEKVGEDGKKIPGSGQIIGSHLPVYQLYKIVADAAKIGSTKGEAKGQQDVKRQIAEADITPGNGPKGQGDKGIDAFDKEMDRF